MKKFLVGVACWVEMMPIGIITQNGLMALLILICVWRLLKWNNYAFAFILMSIGAICTFLAINQRRSGIAIDPWNIINIIAIIAIVCLFFYNKTYLRNKVSGRKRKYPRAFNEICRYRCQDIQSCNLDDIKTILERSESYIRAREITLCQREVEKEKDRQRLNVLSIMNSYPLGGKVIFKKLFYIDIKTITARDLTDERVKKLLNYLDEIKSEDKKIEERIDKEELDKKFNNEVVNHSRRFKYYKKFVSSNDSSMDEVEYCITHLTQLDSFIYREIHEAYNKLKEKYPIGVIEFKKSRHHYGSVSDEMVIENEEEVSKLERVYSKYNQLKEKYPKGLPAFENYNSYDDGKNSAELTVEEIIECEYKICRFEQNAKEVEFYDNWEKTQSQFAQTCPNLRDEVFMEWGCYYYDFEFNKFHYSGNIVKGNFRVWQMFCGSFCSEDDLDYTHFPKTKVNYNNLPQFKTKTRYFTSKVYDNIVTFIDRLKEKYDDEIIIQFGHSGLEDSKEFNDYHFGYIYNKLKERGYEFEPIENKIPPIIDCKARYVIIDLITTNEQLKDVCKNYIRNKNACHGNCKKTTKYECFSNIVYISLLKEFDKAEMNANIRNKEKEILCRQEAEQREK